MQEKPKSIAERFKSTLDKRATPRRAITFLGLWLISAVLLDIIDRHLAELAGGATKLDLRFGYDLPAVQALFESYGQIGRNLYLINLAIDTVMPLFLAITTLLFITLAYRSANLVLLLAIPPIAFFVLDIIENTLLAILVISFPDLNPSLVSLASAITQPKLIMAVLTYGILIISALVLAGRFVINRLSPPDR